MNARSPRTPARTLADRQVFIEVVSGVEGPSLSVGGVDHGERVAGPKPWGGGSVIHCFKVDADNLRRVLNDYVPDTLRAQNAELVKALELSVRIADGWIHDQLDGTSSLADSLAELEPARAALAKVQP